MQNPTHKEIKKPQISARSLADYMAAGQRERARRTIIRSCKYQSIARIVQHDDAKAIVSNFIRQKNQNVADLLAKATSLRERIADSEFERDVFDHNADYVAQFAKVAPDIALPDAEYEPGGKASALTLCGVKVTTEIHFRLRRLTKTNKIKIGAAALRYSKGKSLPSDAGEWQAAYLFGYLGFVGAAPAAEPEQKLCLTIDAYSGAFYQAPSNSVSRFHEMEAACASIAERWPNIEPPSGAIL